jgi:ankyrin repeat protein
MDNKTRRNMMNSLAIGQQVPGPAMTYNEVDWGITYKEMGWLINTLRAVDNKTKGVLKHGQTMLHISARNNDSEEICEALIKAGYNVNAVDDFGHTPLFTAITHGNYEVCGVLLNLGADVNHQDRNLNTPMHKAIAENNLDIMKLLIRFEANINQYNKYMETPLKLAAQEERLELCRYLIDNGGEY